MCHNQEEDWRTEIKVRFHDYTGTFSGWFSTDSYNKLTVRKAYYFLLMQFLWKPPDDLHLTLRIKCNTLAIYEVNWSFESSQETHFTEWPIIHFLPEIMYSTCVFYSKPRSWFWYIFFNITLYTLHIIYLLK